MRSHQMKTRKCLAKKRSDLLALKPIMHQYQIIGRAAPTPKDPCPKIYRMRLFSKSGCQARSKFWYFMKKINNAKKTGGEMLQFNEIFEKHPLKVKNFGITLRYESRTDTHNMYKEYRDTTLNGAVSQMYTEMAGRHRAQSQSIQILKTAVVKPADCRRNHVIQMHKSNLRFPVTHKLHYSPKKFRTTFKGETPNTWRS